MRLFRRKGKFEDALKLIRKAERGARKTMDRLLERRAERDELDFQAGIVQGLMYARQVLGEQLEERGRAGGG